MEPYIKVATGSYAELCRSDGKDDALAAILYTLTHYFQWLNQLELTPAGAERQANRCAGEIVAWYNTRINVKVCCDVCSRKKHDKI